ncbi:hypothetical protein KPNJ1_01078 [Klebsiella pneumoniae 30660/NJST258_1]|uniref:Uncharacterized protein n=1 Tax=Klebsiella pneumoniae 30684/NJST258_2 TaxID=1420013 RepID=W8UD76_KLEPN|nr:hypothetical protein KPNJ2_01109 [Klebsiella pneumoniae 30684/NJST258_2]AHM83484.1 hypothetical protein KPNJ1_01078 [Klebsiella pneumoniae 30660/NJST258_1]
MFPIASSSVQKHLQQHSGRSLVLQQTAKLSELR